MKLQFCKCRPCKVCGYKHYCNVQIDHGRTRIRTGDCPGTAAYLKRHPAKKP